MGYSEAFKVDSLGEITQEHFYMACVAAMAEEEEDRGILGVPCGCSEYILYEGPGESLVTVRNWSHMLSLHIVSKSGKWLVSSHIEGMGVRQVIGEAYRQFCNAKPFIKKKCERAFQNMELTEGRKSRWLKDIECQKVREKIKEEAEKEKS